MLITILVLFANCSFAASSAAESIAHLIRIHHKNPISSNSKEGKAAGVLSRHKDPAVNLPATLLLAEIFRLEKQYEHAETLLKKRRQDAINKHELVRLNMALSKVYLKNGQEVDGLQLLEKIIKDSTESSDAIEAAYISARHHLENDNWELARSTSDWAIAQGKRFESEPNEAYDFWGDLTHINRKAVLGCTGPKALLDSANGKRNASRFDEAVLLYRRILSHYPKAEECLPAQWGIGAAMLGKGQVDRALEHWIAFYNSDNTGPWRGQTLVSIGDIHLERKLDLATARHFYSLASVHVGYMLSSNGADPSWRVAAYDIFLRQGMLSLLDKNTSQASKHFKNAQKYYRNSTPTLQGMEPIPTPVERLLAHINRGTELTPDSVIDNKPSLRKASLICFLGDFYLIDRKPKRAKALFGMISKAPSDIQTSFVQLAYAKFKYADALFHMNRFDDYYAALNDSLNECPRSPWTADILLRKGVHEYSRMKSPEAALSSYDQIIRDHRDSDLVCSAIWYKATVYYWTKDWLAAKKQYRYLLKRFPESGFRNIIENELLPTIEQQLSDKKGS